MKPGADYLKKRLGEIHRRAFRLRQYLFQSWRRWLAVNRLARSDIGRSRGVNYRHNSR
jgi:hypothetical protein